VNHDGEYRYTPAGIPGRARSTPTASSIAATGTSAPARSTSRSADPDSPAGSAHPPAGSPSTGGYGDNNSDESHHKPAAPVDQQERRPPCSVRTTGGPFLLAAPWSHHAGKRQGDRSLKKAANQFTGGESDRAGVACRSRGLPVPVAWLASRGLPASRDLAGSPWPGWPPVTWPASRDRPALPRCLRTVRCAGLPEIFRLGGCRSNLRTEVCLWQAPASRWSWPAEQSRR
jgi:hypothetical protein